MISRTSYPDFVLSFSQDYIFLCFKRENQTEDMGERLGDFSQNLIYLGNRCSKLIFVDFGGVLGGKTYAWLPLGEV